MLSKSSGHNPTIVEKIASYISVNGFKMGSNRKLQNELKLKLCCGTTIFPQIVPLSFFRNNKDLELMLSQIEEQDLNFYLCLALVQALGGKPEDYNVKLDKSQ